MKQKQVRQPGAPSGVQIFYPYSTEPFHTQMSVSGVDYFAASRQASGTDRDFIDFLPLGGETLVTAIGHSFGGDHNPALTTSGLQRLMRGLTAANCGEVSRVVESLNRAICSVSPDPFYTTLFYAWIDSLQSRLRFVSAAHEPAVLIRKKGGEVHHLANTGGMLGLS